MPQSLPHSLSFDDIVIDFVGGRLLRGGTEQPLEPKAFSVLVLLAGEPGRLFTRDEILDAVWGHHHVTPGVLNRVVTLLRQALAEDAHNPRLLHTVHGVGYRFDLPVAASRSTTDAVPDATPAPAFVSRTIPLPATSAHRADDNSRPLRPVRGLLPVLLLASIAVFVVAGWKWWPRTPPTSVAATAVPSMERSIAVLPLVNASNDPAQQATPYEVDHDVIERQ